MTPYKSSITRRQAVTIAAAAPLAGLASRTALGIEGDRFLINGVPTYKGRTWEGRRIEGLLMNTRMVQGIFDDENPETVPRWAYPDTGKWDAERNTREFIAAMPEWRRHGVLSFDICLQGGNPRGYERGQPWKNNAYRPDGTLKPAYLARLKRILDRADELRMAPMVCFFYFGQDEYFESEDAIRRAVNETMSWLRKGGYRNLLIELVNECDNRKYDQPLMKPPRVTELMEIARRHKAGWPIGVSFIGNVVPPPEVLRVSDYALLHGNGVKDPARIAEMVAETRKSLGYRPMPVLFNLNSEVEVRRSS